jgi:hypothetical protein
MSFAGKSDVSFGHPWVVLAFVYVSGSTLANLAMAHRLTEPQSTTVLEEVNGWAILPRVRLLKTLSLLTFACCMLSLTQ